MLEEVLAYLIRHTGYRRGNGRRTEKLPAEYTSMVGWSLFRNSWIAAVGGASFAMKGSGSSNDKDWVGEERSEPGFREIVIIRAKRCIRHSPIHNGCVLFLVCPLE